MARGIFPPDGGTSEDWPPGYMQPPADTDELPPTQYLIMEVLAARWRLGEPMWTFPDRLRPALNALQKRGLIWWRSAPTEHHVQAYLTEAGRPAAMSSTYRSPPERLLEEALHLRMNGERAPGAGPWPAETWREWDRRAETFLRSLAPETTSAEMEG